MFHPLNLNRPRLDSKNFRSLQDLCCITIAQHITENRKNYLWTDTVGLITNIVLPDILHFLPERLKSRIFGYSVIEFKLWHQIHSETSDTFVISHSRPAFFGETLPGYRRH